MTTIYEINGQYFETLEEAKRAEKKAYYTSGPIKSHQTDYTWEEWSARFEHEKQQGQSISDAAWFAFSGLDLC